MRFLITGAQGFIGRYVTAAIRKRHPHAKVLGLGRSERLDGYFVHMITWRGSKRRAPLPTGLLDPCDPDFAYQQVSLLNRPSLEYVVHTFAPDVVVHLASALARAPIQDLLSSNVLGTVTLLEAVGRVRPAPRVILVSTGGVYGYLEPKELPVSECATCRPVDLYAVSKYAAENFASVLASEYGIQMAIVRLFNVVGPGQSEHHLCGRLVSLVAAAIESGETQFRTGDCGFSGKRSSISFEIDQRFQPQRSPSERSDAGLFDSAVK